MASNREVTYWIPQTLQYEQNRLLKSGELTEIDGGKTCDCHCTDRVVQGIDVCYVILSVRSEEYRREYEWREGAIVALASIDLQ